MKAAISFANADGGFLVFGVDPNGVWVGLNAAELAELDPAKVTELINGVVYPDLPVINFAQFSEEGKTFAVIHIPPSPFVPHATTKDISEIDTKGIRKVVLAKHTVFYRHGGKSDTATPLQLQRMVEKRTLHVRDELVRRVREVPISVVAQGHASTASVGTTVTVARLTHDPSAPAVRLTRAPGQTSGVLLHEELSDGLFEEINNVLDANNLLAGSVNHFVFGDEIYYRIYAERHHVLASSGHADLMLRTACRKIYAPFMFWLTILSPDIAAQELGRSLNTPKDPMVLGAFKAVILLGADATNWLDAVLDKRYKRLTQKPAFYWTFKKMVGRTVSDRRLLAMRATGASTLDVPDVGAVKISQLLESPEEAAAHLSRVCVGVFRGGGSARTLARQLDIAAYGKQVEHKGEQIWKQLQAIGS